MSRGTYAGFAIAALLVTGIAAAFAHGCSSTCKMSSDCSANQLCANGTCMDRNMPPSVVLRDSGPTSTVAADAGSRDAASLEAGIADASDGAAGDGSAGD